MHQEKLHRRLQADRAALRDGVWADLEARHPKVLQTAGSEQTSDAEL
jgi:hypothetical protein